MRHKQLSSHFFSFSITRKVFKLLPYRPFQVLCQMMREQKTNKHYSWSYNTRDLGLEIFGDSKDSKEKKICDFGVESKFYGVHLALGSSL